MRRCRRPTLLASGRRRRLAAAVTALAAALALLRAPGAAAQAPPALPTGAYFDTSAWSASTVRDVWVDPVAGSDANSGASRAAAKRTLTAAWNDIPGSQTLTGVAPLQGVRIRITAGTLNQASSERAPQRSLLTG